MKTFVTDYYQIAIYDDGGFKARIDGAMFDVIVEYNPSRKDGYYWSKNDNLYGYNISTSLAGLWLNTWTLKKLHKALEAAGIQELMNKEIVFVENEKVSG